MLNLESENFIQFGVIGTNVENSLGGIFDRIRQYELPGELKYEKMNFDQIHLGDICPKNEFDLMNSDIKLFSPKNSTYSLYASNLQDGWHSLFYGISKDLKCKSMWIRSSGGAGRKDQYVQNFEIYEKGNLIRMVNLYWDRKWVFYEKGEALDIENKSKYVDINIEERLRRSDLINILAKFFPDLRFEGSSQGYRLNFDRKKI